MVLRSCNMDPKKALGYILTRLVWIDAAKGIAIFFVVLGHAWDALGNKGLITPDIHEFALTQISRYHMPLFFTVAGLFVLPSLAKTDAKGFFHKQFWQLLYPMFIWYYIFLGAKLIAGPLVNEVSSYSMLFEFPAPGHWHYWFLWALLLIRVATFLMKPLLLTSWRNDIVILGLCALFIYLQGVERTDWIGVWFGPAIAFSPYFFLGILVGKYLSKIKTSGFGLLIASVYFLTSIFISTTQVLKFDIYLYLISISLCLSSIYILIWLNDNFVNWLSPIARLGVLSMPIYLAHPIFAAMARETMFAFGIMNVPVQLAVGTLSGVFLSLLLYFLALKMKMGLLLGFSPPSLK